MIRTATAADMPEIMALWRENRKQLGFIPSSALKTGIKRERVLVWASEGREVETNEFLGCVPAGTAAAYMYFTTEAGIVSIHQLCVSGPCRRLGIGTSMIVALHDRFASNGPVHLTCKVRGDLPANLFWHAIGFCVKKQIIHETSQKLTNIYLL